MKASLGQLLGALTKVAKSETVTEHTYRHRDKTYDVFKLWELAKDIPSTKLPVDSPDVRDYMGVCSWTGKRSPREVLKANDDAHGHMTRIRKADLRRPMILSPNYGVADGLHRLAKAVKEGKKYIRVRQFDSWDDMASAQVTKKTASKNPARWEDPVVFAPHAKLTKRDLFEYYDNQAVKKRILDAVGKTETLIRQSFAPQLMILRRKDGQGRLIHLGKEYNRWNDMRMSEVHPTFGAKVNFILADIDPQSKVPWRKTKNITETVAKTMSSHPDIKNVEIQFSGGRGFYVKGYTSKEMDIDRARKMTQDILGGVAARPDVTFGIAAADQIRLDTTPLKRRGSVRAPYSLNTTTGLVSAPVRIEDLPHVQKEDFVIKRILSTIIHAATKRASAEFAPGIPKSRKIETLPHFRRPRDWTMVVQVHDAKRAGKHWDLRLVDPKTEMAHSFAVPRGRFPGAKDRMLLAIQQPTHTANYALNFEGEIPAGTYGAGKVTQELKEKVRILKSSDDKLQFERPDGNKYTLFRTKDSNWGIVKNN